MISYCTPEQVSDLFFNFYPESSKSELENFLNRLTELGLSSKLSPAVLQGHFLMYKNDPDGAALHADSISELLPKPKMAQKSYTS